MTKMALKILLRSNASYKVRVKMVKYLLNLFGLIAMVEMLAPIYRQIFGVIRVFFFLIFVALVIYNGVAV